MRVCLSSPSYKTPPSVYRAQTPPGSALPLRVCARISSDALPGSGVSLATMRAASVISKEGAAWAREADAAGTADAREADEPGAAGCVTDVMASTAAAAATAAVPAAACGRQQAGPRHTGPRLTGRTG